MAGSLLADAGHVFHCEVEARDKGHPPRVARGVLQIYVGENIGTFSGLHFQNDTYIIDIIENTPAGREIVQVKAIPPHGQSAPIMYSIKSGNEENAVDIDSRTGKIFYFQNKNHL